MPRIIFIQPRFTNKELDRNVRTLYPVGLGYLAAYVPPHWDVEILDEQFHAIDFSVKADIIAFTTTTLTINRVYVIASEFRRRGVTVILGGVHASMCPDEAAAYCDALCIGDGEQVIGEMIADFEKGTLKKRYTGGQGDITRLRYPRRDLFEKGYSFLPVATTRGCPFKCSFCAINKFYNGKYRLRDPRDVIDELKGLPPGYDIVFFTDGNMYGYSQADIARFKELCRLIADARGRGELPFRYFTCYASVNALADQEALDLASAAGCFALFVGFESINPDSLKDMNKTLNLKYGVDSYRALVENAQRRKMLVVGEMIVGSDSDTADVLKRTGDFLRSINFDILRLQIMQPLPGTELFEKLKREGRLELADFPADWQKLSDGFTMGVHFAPKNLSKTQLQRWVKKAGLEFYSPLNMVRRAWKTFRFTGRPRMALTTLIMNFKSRKTYANAVVPGNE
jgi:radical SAM superfamily enzyme YgiQ (UPF0313 family)